MFAFQLALQLGCTVEELLERITWREFVEWQAFARREPFGALADDYRAALPAGVYLNSRRARGTPAVETLHLMPWRHPEAFTKKPAAPAAAKPTTRRGAALSVMRKLFGK